MIKLKNLKSDFQFKRLLGQKKIHIDYGQSHIQVWIFLKNSTLIRK